MSGEALTSPTSPLPGHQSLIGPVPPQSSEASVQGQNCKVWTRETPNKLGGRLPASVCESWSWGQAVPGSEQQRALGHWGSSLSGEAFPLFSLELDRGTGAGVELWGSRGQSSREDWRVIGSFVKAKF